MMKGKLLKVIALRLIATAVAFSCGVVQAEYYFTFLLWAGSGQGVGGSNAHYLSQEEALQAIRSYTAYQSTPYWQFAYIVADPGRVAVAYREKDGYVYGLSPVYGTADAACAAGITWSCPSCSFTGQKLPLGNGTFDTWLCQAQVPNSPPPGYHYDWWNGAKPHCGDPGYSWSNYGGQYDYNGRTWPAAICGSAFYGKIYFNGFDPGKPTFCGVGNPIDPALGSKAHREPVYASPVAAEPLTFEWLYSSSMYQTLVKIAGWSNTYGRRVATSIDNTVFAYRETGFVSKFTLSNGVYVPDADISDRLTRLVDGSGNTTGWTYYVAKTEETESYNASGQLTSIQSRAGATLSLTYSDANTPPSVAPAPGLLILVSDVFARHLNLIYNAASLVSSLTDPAGRVYAFGYDANSNLVSITWPDTTVRQFVYENATYLNALTGIVDETGQRYATYLYDTHGRAVASSHAAGADSYSFVYNADGTSTVSDPLGVSRQFNFANALGAIKNAGVSLPGTTCGVNSSAITYDANGNVSSRTDFNNKKVCYSYDLTRNLETARLEGALSTETCSTVLASPPNRPDVRKITTTWNATYRLPAIITEPAPGGTKTTTFTYDGVGNLTQKSITAPANDGTSNTISRTWSWTYTTYGRLLTATDPDNHTTTTTYYADTDLDLGKRGNVQTITNAAGHVTQFTADDLNGRPLTIVDPNGLTTTLGYDTRGRITSRQVGTETTSYTYDGIGQLTRVTQPDGSYLQYTYDAAHRLIQINDGLNNKLVYTLDAVGNRIAEDAYDPTNALARVRQQVYDSLNRLHQAVGAQ